MPASTARRRSRRNIFIDPSSGASIIQLMASMDGLPAISFNEISTVQRHFGNKSGKPLF
jgi:hypothetical protein